MMAKAILLILVILWSVRVNSCEVDAFVMNVVERKDSLKKQEFFLRSLEEWAKRRVKADLQKLDELPKEQYQKLIDTAQHYQMDCGNGLRLSMWGKYALGWRLGKVCLGMATGIDPGGRTFVSGYFLLWTERYGLCAV